jgi:hypothetical protein
MKQSVSKSSGFKRYLVNPFFDMRRRGWESPFASMSLVVSLFAIGLLVGFVAIPQLKAHILSSATLSLRSEDISGMKVTSDLQPNITSQAIEFLRNSVKSVFLPGDILIGKADKSTNTTGQEYIALWNANGKSFTMLVVVPEKMKKAIYLRVWYTDDVQSFDEGASSELLKSVFNESDPSFNELKCRNVDDAVGKMLACGTMKEISGGKVGVLVRGPIKLSSTKNGTAVSTCFMSRDHPSYKSATYCP